MAEISSANKRMSNPKNALGRRKETAPLSSAQKHAINNLLNRPGWTMEKAERYIRNLEKNDVERIRMREEDFWQRVAFEENKNKNKK